MNNIITDIKALQEETILNLQSSKANNTVRAYKSDFNDFGLFCTQNGFKSLPSEPKIVSLYLYFQNPVQLIHDWLELLFFQDLIYRSPQHKAMFPD